MEELENLHEIQRNILNDLLFKQEARFSELKVKEIESDRFNFHLKRLIGIGLVRKKNKRYQLTIKGKEYANRFDTQKARIEKQAKIAVLIVVKDGINRYLIQRRLKHPYYGFYGFITGKVSWGEKLESAAIRELKEETGLDAILQFKGVKHKIDYSETGTLLEDKFFFVFRAVNSNGDLLKKFDGGENVWLTRKEIFNLEKLFDGVKESMQIANSNKLLVREDEYKVDEY